MSIEPGLTFESEIGHPMKVVASVGRDYVVTDADADADGAPAETWTAKRIRACVAAQSVREREIAQRADDAREARARWLNRDRSDW